MNRFNSIPYRPEKKVCELEDDAFQKKLIRMKHRDRQRNATQKGKLRKTQAGMITINNVSQNSKRR